VAEFESGQLRTETQRSLVALCRSRGQREAQQGSVTMTATYSLSRNDASTPEATHAMGEAFDLAFHVLGQVPLSVKESIAARLIKEAASR